MQSGRLLVIPSGDVGGEVASIARPAVVTSDPQVKLQLKGVTTGDSGGFIGNKPAALAG